MRLAGADDNAVESLARLHDNFLGDRDGAGEGGGGGGQGGPVVADFNSWQEDMKKRRLAGLRFLTSMEDSVATAVTAIVLGPLAHLVHGLMGDSREGVRQAPKHLQFASHAARCDIVARQIGERLFTDLREGILGLAVAS